MVLPVVNTKKSGAPICRKNKDFQNIFHINQLITMRPLSFQHDDLSFK